MQSANVNPAMTTRPQRRKRFWQAVRWPLLVALDLALMILGYVGFRRYALATGAGLSPTDLIYRTLQLVTLESGAITGPISWELEVARLLLPALTATTALAAAAVLFRRQLQRLRLRFLRRHAVICGLGEKGFLLAISFRADGLAVVAIERDDQNSHIRACRERGVTVLAGDATDPALLAQARVGHARLLIAVTGDDGANAGLAMQARAHPRRAQRPLSAFVHLVDSWLCELLRDQELAPQPGFRLELFNIHERGARALLEILPPFPADQPAHLVIVGLNPLGQNLLLHAARRWHDAGRQAGGLTLSAVDQDAASRLASLTARYPGLAQAATLQPCPAALDDPFRVADLLCAPDGPAPTAAVICLDDALLALKVALALRDHRRRHPEAAAQPLTIVVRLPETSGLRGLLPAPAGPADAAIIPFDLLRHTCTPNLVLRGTHEQLARAFHDAYRQGQFARGVTLADNPSLAPWDSLPAAIRESNRQQADFISRQLAAVHCQVVPLTDWDAARFTFAAEEIEVMARLEHERFVAERLADRWRPKTEPKDLDRKTSPALRPWADLPEPEREKDRASARELPAILARAGFQIVRTAPPASLDQTAVERMAAATFAAYCRHVSGLDHTPPFASLSPAEQEQNRQAARDIPRKLSLLGYDLAPAAGRPTITTLTPADVDRLAPLEHARWCQAKRAAGWRFGPETDPEAMTHASLRPWEELPEPEKEKDRALMRAMPEIVAAAGMALVRPESTQEPGT